MLIVLEKATNYTAKRDCVKIKDLISFTSDFVFLNYNESYKYL